MEGPKVSIVIPVYNGSNYLENAIECALNQTYKNIEVIVVNDGSNDSNETEKVALQYEDRIRYFYKENGGVSSALNYGISKMTGDYFSWLSHDDAYATDKIEKSVKLLKQHDMIGEKCIAFTSGYFIDVNGNKIKDFKEFFSEGKVYSGLDVVQTMTDKGTLNGCCMLIPRRAFDDVGGFDELLRYSQDSLMWYKIFLQGYFLVTDNAPNVMYRLHRNQASQNRRDLFEHDALIIAGLLAEPLIKADAMGEILIKYIKRLTKYQCEEAVKYLCDYASQNGCMSKKNSLRVGIYRILGAIRYKLAKNIKKLIIAVRH